jgi:hypothetical protein
MAQVATAPATVLNARALVLGHKRRMTVAQVMAGRNEPLKDAICELAACSRQSWELGDWAAVLSELERCDAPLADWVLTV